MEGQRENLTVLYCTSSTDILQTRNILHGQNVQKPIEAYVTDDMDINVSVTVQSFCVQSSATVFFTAILWLN